MIADYFELLDAGLRQYNPDSPYAPLHNWLPPKRCAITNELVTGQPHVCLTAANGERVYALKQYTRDLIRMQVNERMNSMQRDFRNAQTF